MILTRKKPETDEERRRRFVLAPAPITRSAVPSLIDSPSPEPSTALTPRETRPLEYLPPEPYVVFNNKGRPTGAGGGFTPLSRNQALLEAQQNYKAPFSWKDFGLSALRGFIGGGLPGAAVGSADYGLNQNTRNAYAVGGDLKRTQNAINSDLERQQVDLQTMGQQAQIEALKRKPLEDAQKLTEQERDNLRQVYNAQPYFDPEKNPQHKAIAARAAQLGLTLPSRDEKDDSQLEWVDGSLQRVSRSGRRSPTAVTDTSGQPLVRQTDVPITEDGLTVTPAQALSYRGQLAARDTARSDLVGQREAALRAAQARLQEAQTAADTYQKQLDELDKSAGSITSYEPLTQIDKETGTQVVVKTPEGGVAYTNKKSPERLQYEQQRKDLENKRDAALAEARKAQAEARSVYTPSLQRSGGGPQWSASKWAKANPNGDVAAAKAAARAAGYQVVE